MGGTIKENEIAEELSAISNLPRADLIERWKATYKRSPPKGISRRLLEYSAAYQVQVTRSLMDFSKIIETFDAREVSFVSVTQQFNTANSMGRLSSVAKSHLRW